MPIFISKVEYKIYFGILFTLYLILTGISIRKTDSDRVRLFKVLIVIFPPFIAYFIVPLIMNNVTILPLGMVIIFSGSISYKFFDKIPLKISLVLLVFFLGYFGYPKFAREVFYQKSIVNESLPKELIFSGNKTLNKDDSKPLVLEFWNSGCVKCIKDFPKFQDFYNNNFDQFRIVSVNVPLRRDKERHFNAQKFIDSLGFNFPVYSMDAKDAKEIGINSYPTVLVIHKNQIKYRGVFYFHESKRYNTINIIERVIK